VITRYELEELRLLEELERRSAIDSFIDFTTYTKSDYSVQWFHKSVCEHIEAFENKEIKKLMIFVPPQHGKSELSTRRYPAWTLGRNPNQKLGVISYNQTVASKFGKDIQRIMEDRTYKNIFPDLKLSENLRHGYLKNSTEFEIPDFRGSLVSIGVGGALTSRQIDKLIIDDIYKDSKEAWSPTVRASVWDWFTSVAETRLHNDSQILVVFTRWHEYDLAGRLLQDEADEWEIVSFPSIKIGRPTKKDPRKNGEALWENRHSKEKLMKVKRKSPVVFANLYQQDPKPQEGLLYTRFQTYKKLPDESERGMIKAYCDTADTGSDYLCSVVYMESNQRAFVLDVIYTQDPIEITEDLVADQYTKHQVNEAVIESNAGGRSFGRNVERLLSEMGNIKTHIVPYYQSKNKVTRIITEASAVQNAVYFPEYWQTKFPEFYDAMTKYGRTGKNEHDDAPDTITGVVEELQRTEQAFIL